MKIVLDFDDTIFNTHQMMGELVKISERAGFTKEGFWAAYQKCKDKLGDLDVKILVDFLYQDFVSKTPLFGKEEAGREMNLVLAGTNDFVYSDFFDFVKNFHKSDLILLSFGTTDFQKIKIKNSGIMEYFDEIIITSGSKAKDIGEIQKKHDETLIFIDDKTSHIDEVKKCFPRIVAIKMERLNKKHIVSKSELADCTVNDLYEARRIINDLKQP